MNEERRKKIRDLVSKLAEIRVELETCAEEEREYYDGMPENLQDSEKGQKASETADELETIVGTLEEAQDWLEGLVE